MFSFSGGVRGSPDVGELDGLGGVGVDRVLARRLQVDAPPRVERERPHVRHRRAVHVVLRVQRVCVRDGTLSHCQSQAAKCVQGE